jgi:copper resistance protein D
MGFEPLIFVRAVHFAATVLTSGTVAFIVLVTEPTAPLKKTAGFVALRRHLVMLIWIALAIAILSGAAWLVLLASDILGASIADVCLHGGIWPVLADTRFGLVWSGRLVLVLLLGVLVLRPTMRGLQLGSAAAFIALLALVGHAGATPGIVADFHLASDMVHLLAAGAWLGGLPALVLLLAHARHTTHPIWNDFAINATRRFSILGILSVGALLATGVINSWNLLGGPRDLVATDYGRLVAFKIGLFASMVALAAVNRFHLTPQLPKPRASRALQRNALAEILLGFFVLLFVGVLGTLPPAAHVHPAPGGIPPDAAFVHIHDADVMADVTVDPGRAGRADVAVRVLREDFSRLPAKEVHLTLESPKAGLQTGEEVLTEQADGTWVANGIEFSEPGVWTIRVIVTTRRGKRTVLDAPIVIER